MLVVPWAPAFASSDENDQQRAWLPSVPNEAFAGEISYNFDSVLNKTTATYIAPLGKRDFLHRVFFAAPTVHTIIASYEFAGRIASHIPDTIRVRLQSDEYIAAISENQYVLGTERTLTIDLGARAVQHYLSLSQRIELDSSLRMARPAVGMTPRTQGPFSPQIKQAHVTRTATTWVSTCEFLSMIDQREIRGTVAGQNFTLNGEVVAGLRLFAATILPDSARNRSIDCSSR